MISQRNPFSSLAVIPLKVGYFYTCQEMFVVSKPLKTSQGKGQTAGGLYTGIDWLPLVFGA